MSAVGDASDESIVTVDATAVDASDIIDIRW